MTSLALFVLLFVASAQPARPPSAQQPFPVPQAMPSTPEDVSRVRVAAEGGDAQAEFTLGFLYYVGLAGVPRDPAVALTWYRKGADHGSAGAAFFLAVAFENGQGVPDDMAEALRWFREAAARGNAMAQIRLGRLYEEGRGVPTDPVLALDWYRRAAAQGDSIAENMIGDMFAEGRGVAKDYAEAAVWYRMAADQGNGYANQKLGELYDKGLGVPQDLAEAVRQYRQEAEKGGPAAQFYVGASYRDGRGGLPRDAIEAHKWFNIAAALDFQNNAYAAARDDLEKTMTALDVAEARRRAHDWMDAFMSRVQASPEADRIKQSLLARVDGKQP